MNSLSKAAATLALVGSLEAHAAAKESKRDYDALAKHIVTEVATVQPGELVLISGAPRDIELLEDLLVQVGAVGAMGAITIWDDRLAKRAFKEWDPKYDEPHASVQMKLEDIATTFINVDNSDDFGALKDVSAERIAAVGKAFAPLNDKRIKRGAKQVWVGNGLYPTAYLAKRFGISKDQLANEFWAGLGADHAKVVANVDGLKKALSGGGEVHVTHPNGTDIKFKLKPEQLVVSDGVISPEMVAKGGVATQVWLPAGEFVMGIAPGTAEGTLVGEHAMMEDKDVEGLTLTYKAGKLTDLKAKTNLDRIKKFYDTATGKGKDELTQLDFGINPAVKLAPKSKMNAWMAQGSVSLGVGNNQGMGGDDDTSFGLPIFVPGCTVTLDGKPIVEKGLLKL